MATEGKAARVVPAVFLLSAVVLADEVVLIRLLSFRFWPYFVPLIVSQALLGAGGSGVALHFLRARVARAPGKAFAWAALSAGPACDLAFRLSQFVPFDPFLLLWRPAAWPGFALFFLLLSVPFFLAGFAVAIPFAFGAGRPGTVYAACFGGSAAGALVGLGAFRIVPTESLLRVPVLLGLAASAFVLSEPGRGFRYARGAAAAVSLAVLFAPPPVLRPSQYKDLELFRRLPEARVLAVRHGVDGDYRAVFAPGIHIAPGLSIRFDGDLPPQAAVFADGELRGIVPLDVGPRTSSYLDWMPAALAYRLTMRPSVLQLGLRGTERLLAAERGGASKITAVEPSPELVAVIRDLLRDLPAAWPRGPVVEVRTEAIRSFLARDTERYDVIEVPDISSASFASLGIHAAGETYLLTREGVRALLGRLADGGVLVFSGWLKAPPRESIKILRTVREELEKGGFGRAAARVVVVRGWGTFAVLARKREIGPAEVAAVDRFCGAAGFARVWPPASVPRADGAESAEGAFARGVRDALAAFDFRRGLFDLEPATDDSPYFHRFARIGALPELRRALGDRWIPFVEWGVVFLALSFVVSSCVAAACLLVPPLAAGTGASGIRMPAAGYFGALGLAYMFIELIFLKAGILVLGDGVRAAAWAIGGFAFFSGLGSAWSTRWEGSGGAPSGLFPAIAASAAGGFLALSFLSGRLLVLPGPARPAAFIVSLAPAAFLMGVPFPSGLLRVSRGFAASIPFAWAVNGFFSVAGSSLAAIGALWAGCRATALAGAALYLLAGALYRRLEGDGGVSEGSAPGPDSRLTSGPAHMDLEGEDARPSDEHGADRAKPPGQERQERAGETPVQGVRRTGQVQGGGMGGLLHVGKPRRSEAAQEDQLHSPGSRKGPARRGGDLRVTEPPKGPGVPPAPHRHGDDRAALRTR